MSAVLQGTKNQKSIQTFQRRKEEGRPIVMLTGYDYPTALLLDAAGLDAILVGDSLGMVVLGYENTIPVTMADMLHHCRAVARGAKSTLLIGDMPFLSYQVSREQAVRNAGLLLQQGGMDAVKLEGGKECVNAIKAILDCGIPVMGHLGLTPQSVHRFGGFRPQARTASSARRLVEDAFLLQESGCFSIVMESVPARLAAHISKTLTIPTIGIGAGSGCDGQVLVTHDLLGMFGQIKPRFVKKYADLNSEITRALKDFSHDVREHNFPSPEHTVEMPDDEWREFIKLEPMP